MRDTIDIDFRELCLALRAKTRFIILAVCLCTAASYVAVRYFIPPQYTSSVSMYVTNNQDGQSESALNINDINASQKLVSTCIVILQDDDVLGQIAARLTQEYPPELLESAFPLSGLSGDSLLPPEALRKAIRMSAVNGTEVLRVEAETGHPGLSARVCALMAEVAPSVLQRVVKAGSVEVIGEARPAVKPSSPNIWLACAAGFFIGGAGAVLWVLTRHRANAFRPVDDDAVKDAGDLKKRFPSFSLTVLGEVPGFEASDMKDMSPQARTEGRIPSHILEDYRQVRDSLLLLLAPRSSKAAVISSALPGEGKTLTCANLALAVAQTGAKVLLLDADLRNPAQHDIFLLKNLKGLSGLLDGSCEIADTLHRDVRPHLDIITSGLLPKNPNELIRSPAMPALLDGLSAAYDYILLDSPAVNVVSDAILLSRAASGIVLVARQGYGSYSGLAAAAERVRHSNAAVFGVVINGVK